MGTVPSLAFTVRLVHRRFISIITIVTQKRKLATTMNSRRTAARMCGTSWVLLFEEKPRVLYCAMPSQSISMYVKGGRTCEDERYEDSGHANTGRENKSQSEVMQLLKTVEGLRE